MSAVVREPVVMSEVPRQFALVLDADDPEYEEFVAACRPAGSVLWWGAALPTRALLYRVGPGGRAEVGWYGSAAAALARWRVAYPVRLAWVADDAADGDRPADGDSQQDNEMGAVPSPGKPHRARASSNPGGPMKHLQVTDFLRRCLRRVRRGGDGRVDDPYRAALGIAEQRVIRHGLHRTADGVLRWAPDSAGRPGRLGGEAR